MRVGGWSFKHHAAVRQIDIINLDPTAPNQRVTSGAEVGSMNAHRFPISPFKMSV